MLPQPEALITIASTWPDSTYGHQASMLRLKLSRAPSWSSRCWRIAPQHPDPAAMIVCTPTASSTREVAASMEGAIEGWTQLLRSNTFLAWVLVGIGPAGRV